MCILVNCVICTFIFSEFSTGFIFDDSDIYPSLNKFSRFTSLGFALEKNQSVWKVDWRQNRIVQAVKDQKTCGMLKMISLLAKASTLSKNLINFHV
jgi:hypothetical protein